jgi:hypothetical protein
MKKILIAVIIMAALCFSASAALMPDWVENMQPGDRFTSGEYQTSMGFAETGFTPTDFGSYFSFGDYSGTGGTISQMVSTDYTGMIDGDVTRQVMGQSASAYVATSDSGFSWDPEQPNTAVTAQIGITKDQYAAASTAIVPYYDSGISPSDPSWSATFSDWADVGTVESMIPVAVHQSQDPSTVTISADTTMGWAQLTEVGATSHSDVSLIQTTYNMANGPFAVNSLNGAATLGGAFENAFVDADVPVTISMNSNGFNFWWDQGLMPP